MKQCSKCKQPKALDEFYKRKKSKDGYAPQCRECAYAYHHKYRTEATESSIKMPPLRALPRGKSGIQWDASCGYSEEEWKSFSKTKRWRLRNPELMKSYVKDWADRNKEQRTAISRKARLKNTFGLTVQDYENLLDSQGKCCAICGTDTPTGKWKVFAVDHCHTTGAVRGLLCNECNRGMGLLRDSAELCMKASLYLTTHNIKTALERQPTENPNERLLQHPAVQHGT